MKRKRDAAEQDPQGQNKKAKTEHDNAKAKSLLGSFFQSLRLLLGLSQMPSGIKIRCASLNTSCGWLACSNV